MRPTEATVRSSSQDYGGGLRPTEVMVHSSGEKEGSTLINRYLEVSKGTPIQEEAVPSSAGQHFDIPQGTFRSNLFDCLVFPQCLVACFFPFLIWAQVHKYLVGGTDPNNGLNGYYVRTMPTF